MISMEGVTSELVARNASWVRRQAQQMVHRLPANVEKADLIQAGLIAVAQASITFRWSGDSDAAPAEQESFIRYARQRVRGAMLDELRQMDSLGRGDRRKVKVVQIARERWMSCNGTVPTLARLSELTGFPIDVIASLDGMVAAQRSSLQTHGHADDDDNGHHATSHPVTERDEVEARVDTAIVIRHLERFFARLPVRDRRVIDAYLGIGLTPVELAASLQVTPSRVSSLYRSLLQRLTVHFDYHHHRAIDKVVDAPAAVFDALIVAREQTLREQPEHWAHGMDEMLSKPEAAFHDAADDDYLTVGPETRWG